ncbi:unknown [Bacteroides eggerthii CAG:109]|nr:unknown [Bacteroides eggerthii CAG:109]
MFVGLVYGIFKAVFHESILIQRGVFVEVHFFIFGFTHYLCTELQFVAVLERKFEVGGEFQVLFFDVFLLFGQFFQAELVVQGHCGTVFGSGKRLAFIAQVYIELLFLELEVDVAFVGTFFAGFGITGVPVHGERTEKMFASEGKIHGSLAFQACIAVIGCSGFGLYAYGGAAVCFKVFQIGTVTVFPVVTVVEDTLESQFVVGVDVPVQGCGVTLPFSGYVVLAYLIVVDICFAIFALFPCKLGVVRPGRRVLVGGRYHQS